MRTLSDTYKPLLQKILQMIKNISEKSSLSVYSFRMGIDYFK